MGYEKLSDVKTVVLGGLDKKTGKKNPDTLEGYFIRVETRANRFNPEKPQNFYVFETPEGEQGLFGKAGIDREMKKATLGRMTKVVDTGQTLNTGKGNPMRVFEVYQDKTNAIDVSDRAAPPLLEEDADDYASEPEEEEVQEEVAPKRPSAPAIAASVPDADRRARLQGLLKNRK